VTVSSNGATCFDVTVRDFANAPVAGATVAVNLGACSVTFCPTQVHTGNTVSATTDASGVAHFCICATVSGSCNAQISADGIVLCSPAVSQVCTSAVPQTMSYQGVLTDNGGAIPPDGTYNFVFKVYDDPTLSGAHLLWTENQNSIQVARGGFNVILGMGTPAVPLALPFDKQYYLGIVVNGGAELSPRVTLASSPYSLVARTVADCGVSSASIATGQVVKGLNGLHDDVTLAAGTNVSISQNAQTLTINATGGPGLGGSGTTNQVAKFTGASSLGNSSIFDNGSFVGVGRSSTVSGAEFFGITAPVASGYGGMYIRTSGAAALPFYGYSNAGGGSAWTYLDGADGNKWKVNNQGDKLAVMPNGNVGIGTNAPLYTLDVNGTIQSSAPGASSYGVIATGGNVGVYAHNAVSGTEAYLAGQCCGGYFNGNVQVNGTLSKSAGAFKIDHPLDPGGKYLSHSFVESPDMMNIYNGNVQLDAAGKASVEMPEWFEALNMEFRYQLTAIGAPGPNLYVAEEISKNRFRIAGGTPGGKVSWQVTGIRHDAYAQKHRIPVVEEKSAQDRGRYLHPDLYGAGDDRRVEFTDAPGDHEVLGSKTP
jgi:hypothetical protein